MDYRKKNMIKGKFMLLSGILWGLIKYYDYSKEKTKNASTNTYTYDNKESTDRLNRLNTSNV